jgi:hypothetical protein
MFRKFLFQKDIHLLPFEAIFEYQDIIHYEKYANTITTKPFFDEQF